MAKPLPGDKTDTLRRLRKQPGTARYAPEPNRGPAGAFPPCPHAGSFAGIPERGFGATGRHKKRAVELMFNGSSRIGGYSKFQ